MAMKDYEVIFENGVLRCVPDPDFNTPKGLGNHIFEACEKYTDKLFQICPYTKTSITFGDFKAKSANLAANLRHLCSIQPGDVIMMCMKSSLENALPIAATLYLNAVTCSLDVSFSVRDCQPLIALVEPKIIFVDAEVIPTIREAQENVGNNARLIVNLDTTIDTNGYLLLQDLTFSSEATVGFRPVMIEDGNTMSAIVFSSGTTGLPKGICLSQKGLTALSYTMFNIFDKPNVLIFPGSLYWISGFGMFLSQFLAGTTKIKFVKFDMDLICQVLEEYKVDATFVPTGYLPKLLEYKDTISTIASLKTIGLGGMMPSKGLLTELMTALPNIRFSQGYGLTESSGLCIAFLANHSNHSKDYPESVGTPIAGFDVKVIDRDTEKHLGPNETGEICVRSKYKALGYYKNTSDSIVAEDGFIRTGDLGHYDENKCLYISGRCKSIFKYLSWQIVPVLIENVITQHPAVEEAVVFGIPNKDGGSLPAAAITLRKNCTNTRPDDIVKFVEGQVSDPHKLRGGVYILKEMPRTPSGKIQSSKLYDAVKSL